MNTMNKDSTIKNSSERFARGKLKYRNKTDSEGT